jgi:type VII secretion protein EccB
MTMQSRRDLFHAHRLMTQRASLALLRGEPDIPDQPLRRLNVAAFCSLLVAVIAVVLFFIWGLLGHGGSALQDQGGTLAIDKQTGQAYVFCENGRELCPAVNYASARLALQSLPVNQVTVSQSALAKYPRGPEIGIPGLPPLPVASLLVTQPWSVCTQTSVVGQQATTTVAGGTQTGGSSLGGSALTAATAHGKDYLIWDAQRMAIQPSVLRDLTSTQPVTVPSAWLDALPQGPAFAAPTIVGLDSVVTGPVGVPVKVGQVYAVTVAGGTQNFVMLSTGLARISQTQARLLEFERGAPAPAPLAPSQVNGHLSATVVPSGGLPAAVPAFVSASQSAPLCVVYSGRSGALTAQVQTGGQVPAGAAPTDFPGGADQVALPPGTGALVADAPGPGQATGAVSYFLVTGARRYALASTEVASLLGYKLSQAVVLPAGVVDLLPVGPALDPAQATKTAPAGG